MAADPNDLTDVETARAWLGMPPLADGKSDPVLQLAITAVSQKIAAWCGRALKRADHVEVYDGTGSSLLLLRQYPIVAVTRLSVGGLDVRAAQPRDTYGFRHDGRRTLHYVGGTFDRVPQTVVVEYTAGLDPVPADLAMACLDWVNTAYSARERPSDLVSRRSGDTEERFAAAGASVVMGGRTVPMPASVFAALGAYQNKVKELERSDRSVMVSVWAPHPDLRKAAGRVIRQRLATLSYFLALPDGSAGWIRYDRTNDADTYERAGLYRRDLSYWVEFGEYDVAVAYEVTLPQAARQPVRADGSAIAEPIVTTS